nr:probable calcium-binding protein CML48 [Ipomoea batatas]
MASYNGRAAYSPSAPPLPGTDEPSIAHPYHPTTTYSVPSYAPSPPSARPHSPSPPSTRPHSSSSSSYAHFSYTAFPPDTHPDVIRSFQMVDSDHSGFIEDKELQQALSSGYQNFSLRTIRLLIFLFKNPTESSLRIGPKEFAALWSCLGQWRGLVKENCSHQKSELKKLYEMFCCVLKWGNLTVKIRVYTG